MGLKTTNYKIEKFNLVLPEAYAYVKELTMHDGHGQARVVIQQDRESALNLEPIEEFYVTFDVSRDMNPSFNTVYEILKGKKWIGSNMVGKFRNWKDDIITEQKKTQTKSNKK